VAQAGLGRALALQCVLPERSLGLLGRDKARIAARCAPLARLRRQGDDGRLRPSGRSSDPCRRC